MQTRRQPLRVNRCGVLFLTVFLLRTYGVNTLRAMSMCPEYQPLNLLGLLFLFVLVVCRLAATRFGNRFDI